MTMTGTKFGPYQVLSRVGAGGMGEVFKAHDPRLSRDVAIKVLPASFASDAERLRRFEQEARAVGALNHPNILAVFDIGNHEGQPYIVSELLEGETLRERIDAGTLPIRKAIDYAQQMAQGLAAAHQKGIVHRDMKPENIFITHDGRVKILDFGLAKLILPQAHYATAAPTMGDFRAEGTTPGQVMGTVGYMSPEQVRGADTDHRSDIFSMGTIMYEMFSGQRAFKHDSAVETMSAILKEDPPELTETSKQIPPGLDRIVRHCMEKNPEERFQSARDIAFDLGSLSTASTTTVQKALRERRAKAWIVPSAAAALLLLVGLTGFWLGQSGSAELPRYHQLTFRRGSIQAARLSPDGLTVIYNAAWEGKPQTLYSARTDSPGDREMGIEGEVLSISKNGEMLLLLRQRVVSAYLRRGVLARMPISGGAPREILEDVQDASWGPDGEQIAAVRLVEQNHSTQLEYPIGTVRYTTGGWISHPKVSADGKHIAFIDHPLASGDDQGQAAMVDMAGHVTKFPPMFTSAQGLVWSPDGKEIWFSGADSGSDRSVFAVDMSGKMRALLRVPGDFLLEDLLPDGRLLGIRMEGRRELMGRGPADKEEHNLSWLDWGIPRDITPDGKFYLFEEEGNGGGKDYSVFMRGTDGSPAVKLTNFGVGEAISSDAKLAIITNNTTPQQMYLVPTGAGDPVRLVNDDRDYFNVRFLPDNKTIIYCSSAPAHAVRCSRMDLDSRKQSPIAPEGVVFRTMASDGKTGTITDQKHEYIWPLDGSWADKSPKDVKPIPGEIGSSYFSVRFAPDGKSLIALKRGPSEFLPRRMYHYDLATGEATYWRTFGPPDLTGVPAVSPPLFSADMNSYVYIYARSLAQLYTVQGVK